MTIAARLLILSIVALTATCRAYAAMPASVVASDVYPDSVPDSGLRVGTERFASAAFTVVGLNMGVWFFDRYIQKGDFAYISSRSVRDNFRHGFIWDNDKLGTNMFLHPYHGNLYYNSARSYGYNFWQSGLFALGGSAMWELFMECEYPSTNDIIATPVGGMALGEVAFRASDVLVDDRLTGGERFGREACIFLLSPMRGLTRIVNGDAWRRRSVSGRTFPIPDVKIEFSAGIRSLEFEDEIFDKGIGFTSSAHIEYGDKFEETCTRPYDFFTVGADINIQASQPLLGRLNIMGRLLSHATEYRNRRYLSVGMYQHFDYYDSDTISDVSAKTPYKLAVPASIGCGLIYRDDPLKSWTFDSWLHANAIFLGAVLSDYYRVDERNYNLASGFSLKCGVCFDLWSHRLRLAWNNEYYRMFTWRGYPADIDWNDFDRRTLDAQGDRSVAMFNISELRADLHLWRNLFLTAEFAHYLRSTHYRDFPHVRSSTTSTSLCLTYRLH